MLYGPNLTFGATVRKTNIESHIQISITLFTTVQEQAAPGGSLEDLALLPESKLRSSLAAVGARAVEHFLVQAPVQKLLELSSLEFDYDLIIVDYFYTEALLALGYKYNKPTIGVISTDFGNYMNAVQEALLPVACSPIDYEAYTKDLGFSARLSNIRECMSRRKQFYNEHYTAQEQIIRKHFKSKFYAYRLGGRNSVNDKSFSLIWQHSTLL